MGNNPSKGPSGDPSTRQAPNTGLTVPVGDRKLARRSSNIAEQGSAKATAADPSPSKETATGQSVLNDQKATVQERLQSSNIPDIPIRTSDRPESHEIKVTEPVAVQVPSSKTAAHQDRDPYALLSPSGPPRNTYYGAPAHLRRPPRLPLPIGDATATPGSPVMGPAEAQISETPDDNPLDEQPKQDTPASNTTVDENETLDELQPYAVPTTIKWTSPGNKIYVTGTFVNWEKKFRLHRKYVGLCLGLCTCFRYCY